MNGDAHERRCVEVSGLVQGVGFRPFVYRLARKYDLHGWVLNHTDGVRIEVQGHPSLVGEFVERLPQELPHHAEIHRLKSRRIPLQLESCFRIHQSEPGEIPSTILLPDFAPCDECVHELFEKSKESNRRYRYPFINCTQCGPRYSIIERLPYDRVNTAMRHYALCPRCQREYADPENRRFHAEPNACPECGPEITFCSKTGAPQAAREDALQKTIAQIRAGNIIAMKGVGGFQLLVDATNPQAVARLREKKKRPHKPLALLYPDIESVRRDCIVSDLEEEQLLAQERPIVLLARSPGQIPIVQEVAPGNPNLGIMLPASPLHYLLMDGLKHPVVATSGNLAGEPICIDNQEGLQRLGVIADGFLMHNRAVLRPLDDSIIRVMDGQPVLFRRARGFVPRPIPLPEMEARDDESFLAVGADLKNTVAVSRGGNTFISQHIGDLESPIAMAHFVRSIDDLTTLSGVERAKHNPTTALCDMHPGYQSSRWAHKHGLAPMRVQHHVAHFFSCMAEHGYRGPALGICWDGTGYGEDGTLRGSEFLQWMGTNQVRRVASLREFSLPGGEQAIREPRRTLAGLCHALIGPEPYASDREIYSVLQGLFSPRELKNIETVLSRDLNVPRCSSIGRLFDAVAALLGLIETTTFEGQAAMALEFAAQGTERPTCYPIDIRQCGGQWLLDWSPMLKALLADRSHGTPVPELACAVHNSLAQMAVAVAKQIGEPHVFLSGGAFQNKRLLETTATLLRSASFQVHCHSKIPPNDGGIALGQIYYAQCIDKVDADPGDDKLGRGRAPIEEGG